MTETPHVFGRNDHLVGIASQPDRCRSDVAVIMLTAGMLHHVGPFRLYVRLARELAEHGVPSFRFDLSGIGESLAVGTGGDSLSRAAQEVQTAMDFLRDQYGTEKFVLLGLCSGADDGMHVAGLDDRVVGAVMLDGCGYRTARFYWHRLWNHYMPRVLRADKWRRWLRRRFHREVDSPPSLRPGSDIREFPSRREAIRQVHRLVDRGVKLRFIYSGGVSHYYNHPQQFQSMFSDCARRDGVSVRCFPHMDHVAFLVEDRQQLVEDVVNWMEREFCKRTGNLSESSQVAMGVGNDRLLDTMIPSI